MIKRIKRRQGDKRLAEALRMLDAMTTAHAAAALRRLITEGHDREVHGELLARIAEEAADGASGPGKTVLEKYAAVYRAGRLVKWADATGVVLAEGESPELLADVESAFTAIKEQT